MVFRPHQGYKRVVLALVKSLHTCLCGVWCLMLCLPLFLCLVLKPSAALQFSSSWRHDSPELHVLRCFPTVTTPPHRNTKPQLWHPQPCTTQCNWPVGLLAHTTGEAPCGAHVFEGFFGLENGPVKSDKSQEKTLFGKEMPEDASRHPKPTSYPQTRQDTVVRVFPMESSN